MLIARRPSSDGKYFAERYVVWSEEIMQSYRQQAWYKTYERSQASVPCGVPDGPTVRRLGHAAAPVPAGEHTARRRGQLHRNSEARQVYHARYFQAVRECHRYSYR